MSAGLRIQAGSLILAMFFCFIHCFVRLRIIFGRSVQMGAYPMDAVREISLLP